MRHMRLGGGVVMAQGRALTARGADRRAALLDAAIAVVAEEGSGSLTHRAVARRAPASLASVTYHFSSIDDLRRSMFEHAGQILGKQLEQTAADAATQELPQVMADFLAALITRNRHAVAAWQEMIVAAAHDPKLQPTFHGFHEALGELLAPSVGGPDAGLTVAAALSGMTITALTYPEVDVERFRRSVVDLISRFSTAP